MTQSRRVSAHKRRFGLAVFIGKLSPATEAHDANIRECLRVGDDVLIALGSANSPRRFDYVPFLAHERETMARLMLTPEENRRVHFVYVEDQDDITAWTSLIRRAANDIVSDDRRVTLVGHSKDNSSYYLQHFPGWHATNTENFGGNLSATTFRNALFTPSFDLNAFRQMPGLHPAVREWLIDFTHQDSYAHLVEEAAKCAADVETYGIFDPKLGRKRYGPFFAADFLVIQGDHVLMIERGGHPFKGCDAIPGGFIEPDEDVVEAAIREGKREETGLKVAERTLRSSFVTTRWYSSPYRDPRGRVISASSLFWLRPTVPSGMSDPNEIAKLLSLPKVKGADDAVRAFWMPRYEIDRSKTAFDHFIQINRAFEIIKGL